VYASITRASAVIPSSFGSAANDASTPGSLPWMMTMSRPYLATNRRRIREVRARPTLGSDPDSAVYDRVPTVATALDLYSRTDTTGQWSQADRKVLGRLRHDAYASLPFVAFLTPPAGRLDSGSIGPALSRPYRRSPLCSRSISTSSGIRACSVCLSASRTSPDTKGPGNFPRRSGNRRHKECMQYSSKWYSVDRRPNRQGYTANLARHHGRRCRR
jgi:hypothetical protein